MQTKVFSALQLMAEKDVGAVLVVDQKNHVHGIFSERDYARHSILPVVDDICPLEHPVDDLMTKNVVFIKDTDTIEECTRIMSRQGLRHLPVRHKEQLCGIISIKDVVAALLRKQDIIIDQMEKYISGERQTYFYIDPSE